MIERGLAKSLEEVRSIQLTKGIFRVQIDGQFHQQEVAEAAFEYGWEVYKGRDPIRREIEQATESQHPYYNVEAAAAPVAAASTEYVAGFMFDACRREVALIRKLKPAWQRGKLNGIGGKIKADETSIQAMVREFTEKAGYETTPEQWECFCELAGTKEDGTPFRVDFFATIGDLAMLSTMEAEQVETAYVADVNASRADMIKNLPWLIALALDYLTDGQPGFVRAIYNAA